jgi:hypothetical protein
LLECQMEVRLERFQGRSIKGGLVAPGRKVSSQVVGRGASQKPV